MTPFWSATFLVPPERSQMAKRWRLVTILVAAASAIVVLVVWRSWFPGRPFDRAAWQADATAESGIRQSMADRLLARRTLIGKTRGRSG